jgi:hypothetical protein
MVAKIFSSLLEEIDRLEHHLARELIGIGAAVLLGIE